MTEERKLELDNKCLQLRSDLIDLLHSIQTGHPGGSLSCTEILAALYYEIMNMAPENPNTEGRDRLILSKGHAAPMLYLILADKGYFPKEDLRTLRQLDSHLQGHPCVHKTPGIELSTGPLGLGLGAGIGMALGERLKESSAYIYMWLWAMARFRRGLYGKRPWQALNSRQQTVLLYWIIMVYSWTVPWRKLCPWEILQPNGMRLDGM